MADKFSRGTSRIGAGSVLTPNAPDATKSDVAGLTGDLNRNTVNIFLNTKDFKDVTGYKLMRGVPDFGTLVQFNPYETGYAAFIVCDMPRFMERLAKVNLEYRKLMQNWIHIIEYEFKSFEGLEDMGAETYELGDPLNNINIISKINLQSASEFSLTYDEKSGSPLTKFARLYLTGLKDPRTQVKSYHGLIHHGDMEPGFENEVFTFLFINTDNTMRDVEAAYLLLACQLNSAELSMYNYTKGTIDKREVTVKFSGYPVQSNDITRAARDMLTFLLSTDAGARQIIINSDDYAYTGIHAIHETLRDYAATSNVSAQLTQLTQKDGNNTSAHTQNVYSSLKDQETNESFNGTTYENSPYIYGNSAFGVSQNKTNLSAIVGDGTRASGNNSGTGVVNRTGYNIENVNNNNPTNNG